MRGGWEGSHRGETERRPTLTEGLRHHWLLSFVECSTSVPVESRGLSDCSCLFNFGRKTPIVSPEDRTGPGSRRVSSDT